MAADPPIRAAGAVLGRRDGAVREVALVHRPRYGDWSLPKGKPHAGEHPLRTAVREVAEETGVTPRLGPRLPSVEYETAKGLKRVDYWAAEAGEAAPFLAGDEVDRWEWVPLEEAFGRLSHAPDTAVLEAYAALPERTRPVVVLRHASAGEKRDWRDRDLVRPLDDRGRRESAEMSRLLRAYAPRRVFSSATARCLESLLDYASALDVPLLAEQAFTLGSTTPERAAARFGELVGSRDDGLDGLVVCTHGELVPVLAREACPRDGLPADPSLRKASFWVFHREPGPDGAVVSAERHAVGDRYGA
ncbi:NUDIX hydrolase [Actinocorallia populi]|uniref:NUDIX hydrolase n=1 Tax=Actinocorallia populi TaxID=2079200 RepID=UPI000D094299|nr:NUDIX domain-containing protein [Actinocorallia populi]